MRRRLSLLVLSVTSMVVIAFLVPLGLLVSDQARSRALSRGQQTAQAVASGVAVASSFAPDLSAADLELVVATAGRGTTSVLLPEGAVAGPPAAFSAAAAEAAGGRAFTAEAPGGVEVLVPVTAGETTFVVRTFVAAEEIRRGVYQAWAALGALGVLLVAAAVLLADRLGRSLVRPVSDLAAAAHRMADGDLRARVHPDGPAEVAEAGIAFNHMAERLDDLIRSERESLADLSHRLRTPLTALRLQAEMLEDAETAALMIEDLDRLSRQVDAVIGDARRGSPAAGPRRADLAAAVARLTGFWSILAEEQGRTVTVTVPSRPVEVALTDDEAAAVVEVLLENVFTHTPAGTSYSVELTGGPDLAVLTVADSGPGFTSSGLQERGASGSGSTGLGLDVVRRAAERSGGSLHLGVQAGGGARVEARFKLV